MKIWLTSFQDGTLPSIDLRQEILSSLILYIDK